MPFWVFFLFPSELGLWTHKCLKNSSFNIFAFVFDEENMRIHYPFTPRPRFCPCVFSFDYKKVFLTFSRFSVSILRMNSKEVKWLKRFIHFTVVKMRKHTKKGGGKNNEGLFVIVLFNIQHMAENFSPSLWIQLSPHKIFSFTFSFSIPRSILWSFESWKYESWIIHTDTLMLGLSKHSTSILQNFHFLLLLSHDFLHGIA